MKRSSSAPDLERENSKAKRCRPCNEENSVPSSREYLQLALSRILELQRQIDEGVYVTDDTSDLGDSDEDEDIMQEVLSKVFRDLPGTSEHVANIIDSTSKPSAAQLRAVRDKRVQLSGFEACRRVAVNFVQDIGRSSGESSGLARQQRRCGVSETESELRKRMLGSLDLHLAAKQRDYTARLMRE